MDSKNDIVEVENKLHSPGAVESASEHVDINHNVNAKIQNPLFGLSRHELMARVDQFCDNHGMNDDKVVFQKAALLAQNPHKFESYSELTEEEKVAIRRETTHKWSHPRGLLMTVVMASVGAAVQGWDQTGANGANLSFPVEFGISDAAGAPNAARNQWIVGVINGAPYLFGALVGGWLNDPVNHYFGRRGAIFIAAIFAILSPIGSAVSQTWVQLLVCRCLLGLAMSLKASTTPVFTSENVPANVRGGMVMSWQLWCAGGILLGFSANLAVYQVGPIAWRLEMGSACIPALPLLFIYLCPESPRWLMKKGRYQDAFKSMLRLRNTPLQAARDMFYTYAQLEEEYRAIQSTNYVKRVSELVTIPRVRRATFASAIVMLAQQMCGINIVSFYSSSVFSDAGYSTKSSLLASWGFGLVNFAFAFPAIFTIDSFGRRNLLLATFPNMAWSLLATGLCFLLPNESAAKVPLIAVFIYIFAAFYSVGEGPVPYVYSAEVFPLTHREMGMAWAVSVCLFFGGVLGLTFPRMVGALGHVGAFGFYAGLNVTAFIFIFLFLPETKQFTLEELDYIFGVPMTQHAKYQTNTWLPHKFKKYVLRQKGHQIEPLYHLEEIQGIERQDDYGIRHVAAGH